jgi:23S rRNA pseudouridine1911/1915/1917 synthase
MKVLFEDNHFIAVNKMPGEIVQGDKTGDEPLSESVKKYLKVKYSKPGDVYIGVAHRIDRPVSGVVVFARTSKALARLNELIRDRQIKKTYWAVVKNKPPKDEDVLVHWMEKNEKKNKSFPYKEEKKGRLRAELRYKLMASIDNYHLIEVELLTGRHHQIRAQLASIGCPIKGDLKYGFDRSNKDGSIHLHARKVEFIHPVKDIPIVITAKPPADVIWDALKEKLSAE